MCGCRSGKSKELSSTAMIKRKIEQVATSLQNVSRLVPVITHGVAVPAMSKRQLIGFPRHCLCLEIALHRICFKPIKPNVSEWQFWIKGQGRMTVFNAEEDTRTMDFRANDVGFVPAMAGHYIEKHR